MNNKSNEATVTMSTNGFDYMKSAGLILTSLFLVNCQNGNEAQTLHAGDTELSQFDINKNPINKVVCDPFSEPDAPPVTDAVHGVEASVFPVYNFSLTSTSDFKVHGVMSEKRLFFTDMDVPTRMFSEGFKSPTGSFITDDSNHKLIENFGITFRTSLKLPETEQEGLYELATLSDDGSVVRAFINNEWKVIVDNDGNHPTRMGCASQTIQLSRTAAVPIEIDYYQGPRYHIANVLIYKKSDTVSNDTQCGQSGNNMYFDPNQGSVEKQAYKNLLARGWKVVPADFFFLTQDVSTLPIDDNYNPCVIGTNPVITDMTVKALETTLIINWKTDLMSSSQVLVKNIDTGEEFLTLSDNIFSTTHEVRVLEMTPGQTYEIRAISISADHGKTISDIMIYKIK